MYELSTRTVFHPTDYSPLLQHQTFTPSTSTKLPNIDAAEQI